MAFHKIAIAGATGYLGRKVLHHLLATPSVMVITVLTRSTTHHDFPPSPVISVVSIPSYDDQEALTSALRGHELLISTVAGIAAEPTDAILLQSAILAGIQRFIPSEYTLDVMHPHAIAIAGSTVLAGRIRNAHNLQSLAEVGAIEYTTLITGGILDWWFENENLGLEMKSKKATLYDGGDKKATGCTTDFIAQCISSIVMSPEQTKNRRVRVAEVEYSGKTLLETVQKVTGENWILEERSLEVVFQEGNEAGAKGDRRRLYLGNILKLNFDGEGAAFFEEGLDFGKGLIQRKSLTDIVQDAILVQSC